MNLRTTIKTILFALSFAASLAVYGQDDVTLVSTNVTRLRVDPSNASGGSASDIFEGAIYIPLETTKESTFGQISQLEVTDEYFIIRDENTNSILFFTKAGKFHAKIQGGNSNLDYTKRIRDFKVNRWTKEIIFQNTMMMTWFHYDFNGKKLKEIEIRKGEPHFSDFVFLGEDKLVVSSGYNDYLPANAKDGHFLDYVQHFKDTLATALYYSKDILPINDDVLSPSTGPFFNYGIDTEFFYIKPYNYSIYKVTPKGVSEAYQFIFPLFSALPSDFIQNPDFKQKRIKYIEHNTDKIFALSNCYQMKDNLIFRANTMNVDNKEEDLIYNLKTGTLIAYNHILTDESTCFLPIGEGYNFGNTGLMACDGKSLYTDFSSLEMFQAYEKNADKSIKYSPGLTAYFTKGSNRDNPVLLQIRLKEKL
ncbi:6-bladed beta-propeller [Pedobacter metabolipauper]|uniref:6-bladed beta-propeller protein n=1 Tax=Pedobacter metabolipauper TaxID=425513 RepID=A0A4R6SU92_9SPHI|nr:6-bladed beta-propeller [Pedobacter metabolipauper]TDQ08513.1 6-bladed beta-propeller protein [Pedobacter metabolipauper]